MAEVAGSAVKACVDCAADISSRGRTAYLCVACAAVRKRKRATRLQLAWLKSLPANRKREVMDRANASKRRAWRRTHPIPTSICQKCRDQFRVKGGRRSQLCPKHRMERDRIRRRLYARVRNGWYSPTRRQKPSPSDLAA